MPAKGEHTEFPIQYISEKRSQVLTVFPQNSQTNAKWFVYCFHKKDNFSLIKWKLLTGHAAGLGDIAALSPELLNVL